MSGPRTPKTGVPNGTANERGPPNPAWQIRWAKADGPSRAAQLEESAGGAGGQRRPQNAARARHRVRDGRPEDRRREVGRAHRDVTEGDGPREDHVGAGADGAQRRRRVGAAGRAVGRAARLPDGAVRPGGGRGGFVREHEREAVAVGRRVPGVVERKVENGFAERAFEAEAFAAVVQVAAVFARDVRDAGIARGERGQVFTRTA